MESAKPGKSASLSWLPNNPQTELEKKQTSPDWPQPLEADTALGPDPSPRSHPRETTQGWANHPCTSVFEHPCGEEKPKPEPLPWWKPEALWWGQNTEAETARFCPPPQTAGTCDSKDESKPEGKHPSGPLKPSSRSDELTEEPTEWSPSGRGFSPQSCSGWRGRWWASTLRTPWSLQTCDCKTPESGTPALLHPWATEPESPTPALSPWWTGESTNEGWPVPATKEEEYEMEQHNPPAEPAPPKHPPPCLPKLTNGKTGSRRSLLGKGMAPICENPSHEKVSHNYGKET